MDALTNWVALSSGNGDNGITRVPGALIELLGNLGELAGAVADLMGLVI
ncbi:hypothetical protein CAFEA_09580 [Corynebacterium afermentans subsp. afermentans]|uniref:Uncharacterized protein n=1 Tax=Corynebacterium afermentans TaxID=38286 RepID=A0A9X8WH61_9CORY|nr:hypothetical protein [Corynebacterium afermentans]WJY57485.1 hypothetical protein CAFEA_09580 [Corynebacterium afermentans subsp. afermentans]SIQ09903.1 hypothetical protein SAMN05421802_10648 [Corynebacterium afermentans]